MVQIPKDLWTVPLPLEKISDTFKSKICQDLTLKMEDELSLATRQVGAVVLELAKLNEELDSHCSRSSTTIASDPKYGFANIFADCSPGEISGTRTGRN